MNINYDLLALLLFFPITPIIMIAIVAFMFRNNNKYGYSGNKKIDKKNIPIYRDIPCNGDIYYANALCQLNKFGGKESLLIGAIILKWIKEDKISFQNEKKGVFDKKTSIINLTKDPTFDIKEEKDLYDLLKFASKDGYLNASELKEFLSTNSRDILRIFKRMTDNKIEELKAQNHIYFRKSISECKYMIVMDDILYNDSVKLYGFKKFLLTFDVTNDKDLIDVKLFDEYLMFGYLFRAADKIAKAIGKFYPDVPEEEMPDTGMDLEICNYLDTLPNDITSKFK